MPAHTHNGDYDALRELGLDPDFRGTADWEHLGAVVTQPASEATAAFQARPATEIEVEVYSAPAQFWRFTVHRPQEHEQGGVWIYEPREVLQVQTGSGSFLDYWPMAKAVAGRMLSVQSFGLEGGPADQARIAENT
jgi:hypothetical protein